MFLDISNYFYYSCSTLIPLSSIKNKIQAIQKNSRRQATPILSGSSDHAERSLLSGPRFPESRIPASKRAREKKNPSPYFSIHQSVLCLNNTVPLRRLLLYERTIGIAQCHGDCVWTRFKDLRGQDWRRTVVSVPEMPS